MQVILTVNYDNIEVPTTKKIRSYFVSINKASNVQATITYVLLGSPIRMLCVVERQTKRKDGKEKPNGDYCNIYSRIRKQIALCPSTIRD